MKCINEVEIEGKKVFLRVDWNVPVKGGVVVDDNRIRATIPTIKYLQSKNCKIIIGTHIGRPDGKMVKSLSTKILAKKFSEIYSSKVVSTDYVIENSVNKLLNDLKEKEILILGNLRWYSEEESNNKSFAKILTSYADVYVNDAFAVSHRAHASVEAIAHLLPSYSGFLLDKEVKMLSILTERPRHPFVLVLGGAKISDKIGIIKKFSKSADSILVGGAIANTIKYFMKEDIGDSLYDPKAGEIVKDITCTMKDKLFLPIDNKKKNAKSKNFIILDIGPETIKEYRKIISSAKTIFWNGNMGCSEIKGYDIGTAEIAEAISKNPYVKIVAGGDTVGYIDRHKKLDKFTFVSTGGGAALEFLAGIELPSLKALGYYKENK